MMMMPATVLTTTASPILLFFLGSARDLGPVGGFQRGILQENEREIEKKFRL